MSLVTSIIGGFQSASAATDASRAQVAGATKAGQTVVDAANRVNPQIASATEAAQINANNAAGTAGAGVINASNDAGRDVKYAASDAAEGVTGATEKANSLLNPYIDAGANASGKLNDFINEDKQFTFSQDDPSFQWRLKQGQQAIERSAAARGGVMGGGILKALTNYAQGAASTEYGAAFDRFQKSQSQRYGMLSGVAGMGLNASGTAGANTIGAAKYGGDINFAGAKTAGDYSVNAQKYNGDVNINAAQYGGTLGFNSAVVQGRNTTDAARYFGDTQMDIGNAQAAEHIGRANAWNGMLTGIGGFVDSAMTGGLSNYGKGLRGGGAKSSGGGIRSSNGVYLGE